MIRKLGISLNWDPDEPGAHDPIKALASIWENVKPLITSKALESWDHVNALAASAAIDLLAVPIVWGPKAEKWCTEQWGPHLLPNNKNL